MPPWNDTSPGTISEARSIVTAMILAGVRSPDSEIEQRLKAEGLCEASTVQRVGSRTHQAESSMRSPCWNVERSARATWRLSPRVA